MSEQHPTPWTHETHADGLSIYCEIKDANETTIQLVSHKDFANRIVHAVNCHDELIAAMECLLESCSTGPEIASQRIVASGILKRAKRSPNMSEQHQPKGAN